MVALLTGQEAPEPEALLSALLEATAFCQRGEAPGFVALASLVTASCRRSPAWSS